MPIPALDDRGFLPLGIHDCTLDEIKGTFGRFHHSDRRPQLFAKLQLFVGEARAAGLVRRILVDGSFVTSKPEPNDIDLILIVDSHHDFAADLLPTQYNVVSKRCVYRRFGFDLLVARENSLEYIRWADFFQQIRLEPGL